MKDFNQVYISSCVGHFGKKYKEKWDLKDYNDPFSPAVFFGLYLQDDIQTMINHKGPKIITWGGHDMHPPQLNLIKQLLNHEEIYNWAYPGAFSDMLTSHDIPHKKIYIPFKSYSNYNPTPLGENIYVYKGIHGNRPDHYKWDDVIKPLQHVFGKDRIIFTNHLPMEELIEKYYKDCFVYIKPKSKGGCTTMFELAHMGIRTLGKGMENLDLFTKYKDLDHLLELIMEESKFIGKIRNNISKSTKEIFTGDEWLNLNFWRK
tara:strand:+ start:15765 stop:16547 length:783 start_codon:yes stop_codon:yes gene_type:complete